MFKKIICMGMLIMCVSMGLFSGCNSGTWFKVGYEGRGGGFSYVDENEELQSVSSLIRLVNSVEELKALCDEYNNPAFLESNPGYSNDISKKIREYDETFFKEKSLLIYCATASNADITYKIKGLAAENGELILDVRMKAPKRDFIGLIPFRWTFLIEVKKADITGVTNVKTNMK